MLDILIADLLKVILVQAENEFSVAATHNSYMQAIIDTYRANGIVIRMSFITGMEAINYNIEVLSYNI